MFRQPLIHPVNIGDTEFQLFSPDTPDEVVDELYKLGGILFSECLGRGADIDRKLTSMLGWSIAALASLLLKQSKSDHPVGTLEQLVLGIAAAAAFLALLIAALALKTTIWPAPSERDWFKEGLLRDVQRLKRYHVISLLVTHQEHVKCITRKANCLSWPTTLFGEWNSAVPVTRRAGAVRRSRREIVPATIPSCSGLSAWRRKVLSR
jgi:hypothetical protein